MEAPSRRSKRDLLHLWDSSSSSPGTCGTSLPRGKRSLLRAAPQSPRRHHRSAQLEGQPGKSAYFTGKGDQLRLKSGTMLPRVEFSLEMWIKPEGGQGSPAVITGLYDKCSYASRDRGWIVGIQAVSDQGYMDARFFFSLKTDRAYKVTTITAHQRYSSNQWTHLSVTYDRRQMKMYVDGAQVAVSNEQSGDLFSTLTRKCKILMLGGNTSGNNYRGYLEHFNLWSQARTQREIQQDVRHQSYRKTNHLPQLVLYENFDRVQTLWLTGKDGTYPKIKLSYGSEWHLDSSLAPPPCGHTTCDNVEVITNYNHLSSFRQKKVVRYRVINIYDDEHRRPTVTQLQIDLQHYYLNKVFGKYNITWELSVLDIKNSSLRNRLILANCDIGKIGNGNCDPECNHTLTGYDGGDCLKGLCFYEKKKKRNGVCNFECNSELFNFDGGDCCNPEVTDVIKTCFNPASPYRAYLDVRELKNVLQLDGSTYLNIFFANSSDEDLAGMATWPWDKEALTHLGGIVLNPAFYGVLGHMDTMIHELGHSLGLFHVFRGISEIDSCNDQCMETEPSLETGDLCADTNPTPKHKLCQDPNPWNDTCGINNFVNTPYNNYMSYADDDCTDSFTPNQVARMHCYLDLVYQSWQPASKPPPIPVAPHVVDHTAESVTLEWLPPIDGRFYDREVGSVCDKCMENAVLVQYAFNASSPRPCDPAGHWSPHEAEGPPDVEQACETSVRTWSPVSAVNAQTVPPACPEPQGCYLELHFRYPLVPDSLTIWVTFVSNEWNASGAVHDIKLLTVGGNVFSLGPQNVFCDIPLTISLSVLEEVSGIQVYTLDEHMEIDAAMLTSAPQSPLCAECKPVQYKLIRDPPFQKESSVIVTDLSRRYIDTEVKDNMKYKYQLLSLSGAELSEPSPALTYVHGLGYCGDGRVQSELGEECDDENKLNGDGCSYRCQREPSFNCIDEPSMCYFHDGDGICEDFERLTSVKDCGLYTPDGFLDQWASNVTVSHHSSEHCPGWVVIGHPAATKVCRTKVFDLAEEVSKYAWFPCKNAIKQIPTDFWLKAYFAQPVVAAAVLIHLVADGTFYLALKQETISVQLFDTQDQKHDLGIHILSCRNNPLVIPVFHDLSQPFYRTKAILISFSSYYVAISGVAIRSFHNFDPITISSCQNGEIYSPVEQSCVHYSCEVGDCSPLSIENATLSCSGSGSFNGDQCTLTCQNGYTLEVHQDDDIVKSQLNSTTVTITCTDGKWNKLVTCEPVDCEIPNKYHVYPATFSCPEGTTLGKQCTFQCRPPAQMKGTINILTCMEDGLWSFPEALCELTCLAPPPVPNAVLQTHHCSANRHKVGSFCKYKCKPGYQVHGFPKTTRKRVFKRQCTEDGSWQKGTCIPVTCDPPPLMFHGVYQCTNGFQFNSICWINCDDGENQTGLSDNMIQCRKNGNWTGSFHLCKKMQGECQPPRNSNNTLNFTCKEGYGIGARCFPTCMPTHDPVILPNNMTSKDVAHWMNPPKAQSIVCTVQRQWYPHPETLHCLKACEEYFIGDNYCDPGNNRAFCDYDRGDCCTSTVKKNMVVPFPISCDREGECSCRDPNTKENSKELQHSYHG
ncbi:pappalysin-1 [Latimeria chalumnae]